MKNQFTFGIYISILENQEIRRLWNTWVFCFMVSVSCMGFLFFFNLEPYGGHLLNVLIKFLYLHQLYKLPRNYYNRTPKTGVFGQAFVSFFLFFYCFQKNLLKGDISHSPLENLFTPLYTLPLPFKVEMLSLNCTLLWTLVTSGRLWKERALWLLYVHVIWNVM